MIVASRKHLCSHQDTGNKEYESMKRPFAVLLTAAYCFTFAACAALPRDFVHEGFPLSGSSIPVSGQVTRNAEADGTETWWDRNWPYVVAGLLVGGAIIFVTAADSDAVSGPCCGN